MLYVWFGTITGKDEANKCYVNTIDSIFDSFFEESWTDNDWAKRIIKEIDRSKLLYPKVIESPWLGITDIFKISGGAKALIMMNQIQDVVYNGNSMGDNCFKYLLELSKTKDIAIELYYMPRFDWVEGAKVTCINSGNIITSRKAWGLESLLYNCGAHARLEEIDWHIKLNKDRLSFGEIDF